MTYLTANFLLAWDDCDVYFTTGSHKSAYDNEDWIAELKSVIQAIAEQDKYFVGICFGHQLLGEAMGGAVRKSSNGWCVGVHEFQVLHQESWMQPAQEQVNVLMMCQDQVVELPPGGTILAKADQCPVGIFSGLGRNCWVFRGIRSIPRPMIRC